MFNQNRSRFNRSSIRHSGGFQRSFNRPHYSQPRFNNASRRSKLEGVDKNMFIKKANSQDFVQMSQVTQSFNDFNLVEVLKQNILKHGYSIPTPIQAQAINPILEGRDVIGLASTGTGKTAAFLIPLINKIFTQKDQRVLIIVPTRELAVQINEELRDFSYGMHILSALIIGGTNMKRQIYDLRRDSQVVIATPGRLRDLIERHMIYLEDYSNIVLDEVDLMVDIGFINDVKYFISLMPQIRQSLFFSATIPPKIQDILKAFVKDPVTVSVKLQDTSENVDQDIIKIESPARKSLQLHDLLIQDGFSKVLIFLRTKHGVDKLYRELQFKGFRIGAIHGNKSQYQRQRTLDSFKREEIQILLATDVASRGLDIDNVTHVINYDLPQTYEDYIHRIGRTGRAGNKGSALTFVD